MNPQRRTLLIGGILLSLNLIFFAPALWWLARETAQHEQLRHALLILLFAAAAMLMEERKKLSLRITADARFALILGMAFLMMGGAYVVAPVFLTAAAFALALSAWLGFFYGKESHRLGTAWALAFMLFIGAAQAFEVFDWPLRQMAGLHSAWVLNHIGFDSGLFLNTARDPKLILTVAGRPFEVATECNGYGLISSSALVALLLVAYRRLAWPDKLLSMAIAIFLGSLFNTLRILVIVLLAPRAGSSYLFMHETVGTVFFWGCLILVWLIVGGFQEKKLNHLRI
jgi:exosortase/archaeosortase family protein